MNCLFKQLMFLKILMSNHDKISLNNVGIAFWFYGVNDRNFQKFCQAHFYEWFYDLNKMFKRSCIYFWDGCCQNIYGLPHFLNKKYKKKIFVEIDKSQLCYTTTLELVNSALEELLSISR